MKTIVSDYEDSLDNYDSDVLDYAYGVQYEAYADLLDDYEVDVIAYTLDKITALLAGNDFTTVFSDTRPAITAEKPSNYVHPDTLVEPTEPVLTPTITDADNFVTEYEDKEDVRAPLKTLGKNFKDHKGKCTF